MTTPNIIIDVFVGISFAANGIAFFFIYFVQRRYTEATIVHPLRFILLSTLPTTISIAITWALERHLAANSVMRWTGIACVLLNLALVSAGWIQLRKLRGHIHVARLTKALPFALLFGLVACLLQLSAAFGASNLWVDISRGTAGIVSIVALAFGAARVRSRYPGAGIEALIIIGSMTALVVGATFIGQTNGRTESIVIENQTKVFQEFIARQSEIHLTPHAFTPKDKDGQAQIANFVEQFTTATTKRAYVILPDGLVIGADVPERIGTRAAIDPDIIKGLQGTGVVRYAPSSGDLPPAEQSLGSAMVVTMPLRVSSGQGTLGVLRLFLDGSTTDIAAAGLQARAVGFTFFYIILTQAFLFAFFLIFRKTISHPFAELQDELKNVHEVSMETGENRRLVIKAGGPFQKLADDINHIINEDEQRVRDLKHALHKKGWQE